MMGRVGAAPHPLLLQLLYQPALAEDLQVVLPYLLRIDAAHVLMLAAGDLLASPAAAQLLNLNRELARRLRDGEEVLGSEGPHRGLYWLYEQEFICSLGAEVGGTAHLARSRNDINATVARLRARDELLLTFDALDSLLEAVVAAGTEHAETLMSCFTHLQPAQPSTLGHYFAGVGMELARSGRWLASTFEVVNRSPMGAAAGAGTSFPVDRERVAGYLGFSGVVESSLDAVASRDYLVQILSAAAMLGSTLTRLASDLQLWSSHAYGFLGWPDELVSTSSIMPQKRNAFVLENIRGQAVRPSAALMNTLLVLKSAPFANGVEVSSEATAPAWPAFDALRKALQLTTLLLRRLEVFPARMRSFLERAETTMTSLADFLVVRHGLAFRTAHEAVATLLELPVAALLDAEAVSTRLEEILATTTGDASLVEPAAVAMALDPVACLKSARYGGGPAPESVRLQLSSLDEERSRLAERIVAWRRDMDEADQRLARDVEAARDRAAGQRIAAGPPGGRV
jgi:argininosuccinate lyase